MAGGERVEKPSRGTEAAGLVDAARLQEWASGGGEAEDPRVKRTKEVVSPCAPS